MKNEIRIDKGTVHGVFPLGTVVVSGTYPSRATLDYKDKLAIMLDTRGIVHVFIAPDTYPVSAIPEFNRHGVHRAAVDQPLEPEPSSSDRLRDFADRLTMPGWHLRPHRSVAKGLRHLAHELERDADSIPRSTVEEYLDMVIEHWRAAARRNVLGAECYVDAFQSARSSLLGEVKP